MLNPLDILHQYYEKDSELYHILLLHSEQVRDKALSIAAKHPELQLNTTFLAEAAMLHDIGIFMTHAPRIYCHGTHEYIQHGYLGADLLREAGLPKHALVCERHTGVGITLEKIIEKNLPLPHRAMVPVTQEEKVICYADKFFSKSDLHVTLPPERILKILGHHGDENIKIFTHWHEIYG